MEQSVSIDQIKGSLGSLLILWSSVERAIREEVSRAHGGQLPKSAHGIAAVLRAWEITMASGPLASPFRISLASSLCEELREKLVIRNGVCHGLVGISAEYAGKPATLSWEFNDEKRSITWDELQSAFSWLSSVPIAVEIISNGGTNRPGCRMTDSEANRDWWNAEYAIKLSGPEDISL